MAIKKTVTDIFGETQGEYYSLGSVTRSGADAEVRWDFYVSKEAKDLGGASKGDAYLRWVGNSPFTEEALSLMSEEEIAHEASLLTNYFPGGQWVD
jgi:hypothetical protein